MTAVPLEAPVRQEEIDWRLRASMGLTIGWLVLGVIYISMVVGWGDFASQQAPALGSFLEGAFAPLAFLWLVVGFFLQQQQLRENTESIRAQLRQLERSAEQSEVQSRAIAADELHSRQDTFLRVNELVKEQLGMIGGWILTSYTTTDPSQVLELWHRHGRGEHSAFSIEIMRACLTGEIDPTDLFHGTELRHAHSVRFIEAFERLVNMGQRCDPEGIIMTALRDGIHGRIYRLITENRQNATNAFEPAV
jgi:hypothetical protein